MSATATPLARLVGMGPLSSRTPGSVPGPSRLASHFLPPTHPSLAVGIRQWTWQTCSQFGYYQSCDAGTACPFSSLMTLQSNYQICTDAFDGRVAQGVNDDRINFTNDFMGGKALGTPGTSSRIVFINGGIDPWHALSILPSENSNPSNAAVFIPSGAHCRAMQPSSPSDPADVKAARLASAAVLDGWLAQAAKEGATLANRYRRA